MARKGDPKRDKRIVKLRRKRLSMREIGRIVGLDHSQVVRIIKRDAGELSTLSR